MSSSGWWPGPYRRELCKIMESGYKSNVKKAVSIMVLKQTGNEFIDFLLFPGMVYSQ